MVLLIEKRGADLAFCLILFIIRKHVRVGRSYIYKDLVDDERSRGMGKTARNWLLTINNPSYGLSTKYNSDTHKIVCGQLERGETGTLHWQAYVEYKKPVRIGTVKKDFPGCHAEVRRGSRAQSLRYCYKDRSRVSTDSEEKSSDGHLSESRCCMGITEQCLERIISGEASNKTSAELLEIQEKIKNGADEETIANDHFPLWVRYYKAFERYRVLTSKPRNHEMTVVVLQGPTGTGKSRWAMDTYPGAYWKQRSNWWCGYSGESTVILDEFYGWLPFDLLLRLCDRYPLLVESKGGQIQMVATTIIITSNSIPDSWYNNIYFDSFARRVTTWKVLNRDGPQSFNNYSDAKLIMQSF